MSSNLRSSTRKSKILENVEENQKVDVSPPKQRKSTNGTKELFSPSRSLGRLSIEDIENDAEQEETLPKVRNTRNKYQNARKILNSAETNNLIGREVEQKILSDFLHEHLDNCKSGSLYVSGPPGTGKTACLSHILKSDEIGKEITKIYINCTSISTVGSIYKKICAELKLSVNGKTERESLNAIEKYLKGNHGMILMVLDEVDQLIGRKQSVLYTIFEWPAKPDFQILLVGIANSLDLTDRMLIRLNAKCDLKPKLLHFQPYTKQQIIDIFKARLEEAGVMEIFPPVTIQLLAGKVAAVSGDVRRALDIGRRVVEIAEQKKSNGKKMNLNELNIHLDENNVEREDEKARPVELKQVVSVLNNVYGVSQTLNDDIEDSFPLQQKILICSLLVMLRKEKNKDITIGRLHDVYKRICSKRNILAVDQAEFVGLCSLVETRGILRIVSKKESRLSKVVLQWDEEEVNAALKDKQLIAAILNDASCLSK